NIAFIEELYEKWRVDPESVSASWREFFQGYEPAFEEEDVNPVGGQAPSPVAPVVPAPRPVPVPPPTQKTGEAPVPPQEPKGTAGTPVPLRGAASKIVQNMEASLTVPTATSVRNIPVKVLEENR